MKLALGNAVQASAIRAERANGKVVIETFYYTSGRVTSDRLLVQNRRTPFLKGV